MASHEALKRKSLSALELHAVLAPLHSREPSGGKSQPLLFLFTVSTARGGGLRTAGKILLLNNFASREDIDYFFTVYLAVDLTTSVLLPYNEVV